MICSVSVPQCLAGTVDAFWSFASFGQRARILPDGCMDFVFDLNTAQARLVGAMTRADLVAPARGTSYFGVRFLPGTAARLIDAPAGELTDLGVELTALLPGQGRCLPEQIAEAKSDGLRVRVIERYLQAGSSWLRAEDARVRAATAELARTHGATRVREVAFRAGVSERQLERLFRERVGVGPKVFARVMRLQRTVALLAKPGLLSLGSQAELAQEAGYADEAHLLRDFRELAATTPGELAREHDVGFVQDGSASVRHASR
jgi:AraC-like DNA-binding protein